jgi:hypothetical protein
VILNRRTRTPRLAAAVAVGLTVALGATGCSIMAPQATTIEYSASDGVNVPASGPLKVRNALIVADEAGTAGNLLAAIVNETAKSETLNVGFAGRVLTVQVPANSVLSLGAEGATPLLIDGLGATPGHNVELSFQSGDGEGVELYVPVLDGMLPQYAPFAPAPALAG